MGDTISKEQKPVTEDVSTTMYNLTFSHVISQYLYVVAKLDVATIIGKAGKSITAEEIAKKHHSPINVEYLERILRLLSSTKAVFTEIKKDNDTSAFGLTELSQSLRSDIEKSVRPFVLHCLEISCWRAWALVEHCTASQEQRVPFMEENGVDLFEFYRKNPESGQAFNDAMTIFSQSEAEAIISFYSEAWKELERKEATVLDVGGGHGLIMKRVKQQYPKLKCKVLDLREVIESAPKEGCGVDFISGDFFWKESLPKSDVILMKHILHDWNDANSQKILKSCHYALNERGKLILCETVLPGAGDTSKREGLDPFFLDAQMMLCGSRERTAACWTRLLYSAGFKFEKIVETPVSTCQIIEARKF